MIDEPVVTPPAPGPRALVGREREVRVLEGALRGVQAGQGRAIALVGEPGIGKSALIVALIAWARAAGIAVVARHGRDVDAHDLDQLPGGGAVMVTVDNLHQLGADELPTVQGLFAAAADRPVLVVMAYRERQLSPALAAVLTRAAGDGTLELLRLEPFSLDQTRLLLADQSDQSDQSDQPDPPDLADIHRAGLGNPEYLKVLAAQGDQGEASAEAATAIIGELADLDDTALTVVEAAAVLGGRFHPEVVAAVAGLDVAETARVLDALTRVDLVRPAAGSSRFALRHRAVTDVVYGRLEPGRRLAMHRRAEAALADRGAPIEQRAFHVARAVDPSRPDHVTTLIAAARDLLHSAPAVALGYLEAVVPLLRQGEAHWHEAQVLRARAHLLTGKMWESRALFDVLRPDSAGQPRIDGAAVADAGRIENWLGRHPEAAAIARSGLAALPDHDTVVAAALYTELADAAIDQQQYEAARRHAGTAAAIARRHYDGAGEANALAQASVAHLFTADQAAAEATATRAAELIDAATDATLLTNLQSVYQLGLTEGTLCRLTDAERHLTRGLALSRRTGQTYILPSILKALGDVHLRSGDLRRAVATFDEVARHIERDGSPATRAIAMVLRAKALLWQGGRSDERDVLRLAESAVAIANGAPTGWAVMVRCLHAEIVLLSGDAVRSKWLLLEAGGGEGLPRITAWRKPRWCDCLAQAALIDANQAAADEWARLGEDCVKQLPSAGRHGFALRARMHAHVLRGNTERALRCAEFAVEDFAACGKRIDAGRTLLAAATLSLDANRTDGVDNWLSRAAYLADQCGSARLAGQVAAERARLAAHGRRTNDVLAVLSAREREIAGLASTGMTSREIAAVLKVSVRTVDTHLGRAYEKLGVRNRAELTRTVLNSDR